MFASITRKMQALKLPATQKIKEKKTKPKWISKNYYNLKIRI